MLLNSLHANSRGQMRLAGARPANDYRGAPILWEAGRHTVKFEGLELGNDLRAYNWIPLTTGGAIAWRKPL